jgi:hypothetical protein
MSRKAIATFGLCCGIPVLFAVPGISAYPLTVIGGILAALCFINMPGEPTTERQFKQLEACEVIYHDEESMRQRAKPCSA